MLAEVVCGLLIRWRMARAAAGPWSWPPMAEAASARGSAHRPSPRGNITFYYIPLSLFPINSPHPERTAIVWGSTAPAAAGCRRSGAELLHTITTIEARPMASRSSLLTVATYRGVSAGWVAVGQPRPAADAVRLLRLVQAIRPDYCSRLQLPA